MHQYFTPNYCQLIFHWINKPYFVHPFQAAPFSLQGTMLISYLSGHITWDKADFHKIDSSWNYSDSR